jgi:hypothetical protein
VLHEHGHRALAWLWALAAATTAAAMRPWGDYLTAPRWLRARYLACEARAYHHATTADEIAAGMWPPAQAATEG